MSDELKTLVIAAHPDDEVLGCGGTIARLTQEGNNVYTALLGEGITSRYQQSKDVPKGAVDELHKCSRQAAGLLGVRDVFTNNLPDNRFDTIPFLDVVKIIEKLIEKINPSVVYTHQGGDLNIDHQIVHRAVLTATRPVKDQPVREIYAFCISSSTEWAFQSFNPPFQPNVFVNISETLDIKVKALSCYKSEIRKFPHPRSPEAITTLARYWGSVAGYEAAEPFMLIRSIR